MSIYMLQFVVLNVFRLHINPRHNGCSPEEQRSVCAGLASQCGQAECWQAQTGIKMLSVSWKTLLWATPRIVKDVYIVSIFFFLKLDSTNHIYSLLKTLFSYIITVELIECIKKNCYAVRWFVELSFLET